MGYSKKHANDWPLKPLRGTPSSKATTIASVPRHLPFLWSVQQSRAVLFAPPASCGGLQGRFGSGQARGPPKRHVPGRLKAPCCARSKARAFVYSLVRSTPPLRPAGDRAPSLVGTWTANIMRLGQGTFKRQASCCSVSFSTTHPSPGF